MGRYLRWLALPLFLFIAGCDSREEHYAPSYGPSTEQAYIVGVHPYLNALQMQRLYGPLLLYLQQNIPGASFRLETSENYDHYDRKLLSEQFDFSIPNPYETVLALEHRYAVIAKVAPDSEFRGIVVARKERHLKEPKDLRGQSVSFPAPTALAATMMPLLFFKEHGLNIERDITKKFVGSQVSSILNAYTGDTAAACTWPVPWREWSQANPDKAAQMEVVWQTHTLPHIGVVAHKRVDPALAQKVAEVLIGLNRSDEGRALLQAIGLTAFEKADNATYDPVRRYLERYEALIGLPMKERP